MAKTRHDDPGEYGDPDGDEEVDDEDGFDEEDYDEGGDADEAADEEDAEGDSTKERYGVPEEAIRLFEKTEAQLEGFYEEIGNISKRKPDDAINKFKLGFINQMLERANTLLGATYRPFPDFERFDPDALPTASDVVTMLAQYLRSMDKFRKDHTYVSIGQYVWYVSDSAVQIRAKRPKGFSK